MKWHTPQEGERRIRRLFAFTPWRCSDGLTRWLEKLDVEEVYRPGYMGDYWEVKRILPASMHARVERDYEETMRLANEDSTDL